MAQVNVELVNTVTGEDFDLTLPDDQETVTLMKVLVEKTGADVAGQWELWKKGGSRFNPIDTLASQGVKAGDRLALQIATVAGGRSGFHVTPPVPLVGERDPRTRQLLEDVEDVVRCRKCSHYQARDTWDVGGRCALCDHDRCWTVADDGFHCERSTESEKNPSATGPSDKMRRHVEIEPDEKMSRRMIKLEAGELSQASSRQGEGGELRVVRKGVAADVTVLRKAGQEDVQVRRRATLPEGCTTVVQVSRKASPTRAPQATIEPLRGSQEAEGSPALVSESRIPVVEMRDRSRIEGAGWSTVMLATTRCLIVGGGAIGNEVAKNLALVGVRCVTIVDLDTVEGSNLTRSVLFRETDIGQPKATVVQRAMREIDDSLEVHALHGRFQDLMGVGAFRRFDLVFCCVDSLAARIDLARACMATRTPMVEGGVDGLTGTATITFPPDTACFDCGLYESTRKSALNRHPCEGIRLGEANRPTIPFTPTITSIIGGIMVQWGLQYLSGTLPASQALIFTLMAGEQVAAIGPLTVNRNCPTHGEFSVGKDYVCLVDRDIVSRADWTLDMTVTQLLEGARSESALRDSRPELHLGFDLITGLRCPACGFEKKGLRRRVDLLLDEAVCPNRCHGAQAPMAMTSQGVVSATDPLAALSLRALTLRPFDLVGVNDARTGLMVDFEIAGAAREVFGGVDFGDPKDLRAK